MDSSEFVMFSLSTVLMFTILSLISLSVVKMKSKMPKLPPGPPVLPLVGNLLQLSFSGKQFFEYIRDLQPKYGPIFILKLGTQTVIMVTCPQLAHEAFIKKGQIFANRPADLPNREILNSNRFAVTSASYNLTWRSLRRNLVQGVLSSAHVKDFRDARNSAIDRLMDRLQSEAESTHGVVSVLKNSRFTVMSILLSLCLGLEMNDEAIVEMDKILKKVIIGHAPALEDYVPLLAPFLMKQKNHIIEAWHELIQTLLPFIKKRRSILQNPGSRKTAFTFAYVDTLFDLKVEGRNSVPTDTELVTLCAELLNAGTDTTDTAIEWAMARLVQKPDIQSRLFLEITSTVGNRKIDEEDLEKMPYLDSFTKELLRKHPPVYFLLTQVTQPTKLGGYDIPLDARINFYLPSIGEDPRIWSNPTEFDPERFASGAESADVTGVTSVKMMPFGVGRKICPGLDIATIHLKLMVARMVQEFEWCLPRSQVDIDFTATFQFTVVI